MKNMVRIVAFILIALILFSMLAVGIMRAYTVNTETPQTSISFENT